MSNNLQTPCESSPDPGRGRRLGQPSITVAIPTRNRATLLRLTLQSVLDQSFPDVEIFVSDNASTDDTAEVVAGFAHPIHYVRNERDVGSRENQSRCLALGTAPLLTILHDDDLLLTGSLPRRAAILNRHPNVGFVHSTFQVVGPSGQPLVDRTTWADVPTDPIEAGRLFIERSMSRGCRVAASSVMLRRSVTSELAFEERFGTAGDLALWLRIAQRADVAYLPTPTIALRVHANSLSAQGAADYEEGGYSETVEQTALVRATMLQFVAESEWTSDSRRLRRLALKRSSQVLTDGVRRRSMPGRRFGDTWRLLAEAAKVERSLYLAPGAVRLLAASLIGEAGRSAVRRLRDGFRRQANDRFRAGASPM